MYLSKTGVNLINAGSHLSHFIPFYRVLSLFINCKGGLVSSLCRGKNEAKERTYFFRERHLKQIHCKGWFMPHFIAYHRILSHFIVNHRMQIVFDCQMIRKSRVLIHRNSSYFIRGNKEV